MIGLFAFIMVVGWCGLTWCWQQGTGWGLLGTAGYLAWALLWSRAYRSAAEYDPDMSASWVATGARVVWWFGFGVPIVYGNLLAWHLPVLAVVLNLASVGVAVWAVRARRKRAAQAERAARDAEYAAEEAAIQAEIDAEEAERARLNMAVPPAPRRWAPPGYEGRDERYWRHGQGFHVP